MNNEETTVENLENLTDEELAVKVAEADKAEAEKTTDETSNLEAENKRLANRNSMNQRQGTRNSVSFLIPPRGRKGLVEAGGRACPSRD